jgi:16S rRNA (guanine527-N7)-methyltransferase
MGLEAGLALTPEDINNLSDYWVLLAVWNAVINLTGFRISVSDPDARALDRLVIEPLRALPLIPPGPLVWFDIGSGGGSPALPLKVMRPDAVLTMVESRSRKAAFLREAVRSMGLTSVKVLNEPVEAVARRLSACADLVTVRAVRAGAAFACAAADLLRPDGRILWFGPGPREIPSALQRIQLAVPSQLADKLQVLGRNVFHVKH